MPRTKLPGAVEGRSKLKYRCHVCSLAPRGCDLKRHYRTSTDWDLFKKMKEAVGDKLLEELRKKADPHTLYIFQNKYNKDKLPSWQTHVTVKQTSTTLTQDADDIDVGRGREADSEQIEEDDDDVHADDQQEDEDVTVIVSDEQEAGGSGTAGSGSSGGQDVRVRSRRPSGQQSIGSYFQCFQSSRNSVTDTVRDSSLVVEGESRREEESESETESLEADYAEGGNENDTWNCERMDTVSVSGSDSVTVRDREQSRRGGHRVETQTDSDSDDHDERRKEDMDTDRPEPELESDDDDRRDESKVMEQETSEIRLTDEDLERLAEKIAQKVFQKKEEKEERMKEELERKNVWEEGTEFFICKPCSKYCTLPEVPSELIKSRRGKGAIGVIGKLKENGEPCKSFQIKSKLKEHCKSSLHIWCVRKESEVKTAIKSYEEKNKEVGKIIIRTYLKNVRRGLSSAAFQSDIDFLHLTEGIPNSQKNDSRQIFF